MNEVLLRRILDRRFYVVVPQDSVGGRRGPTAHAGLDALEQRVRWVEGSLRRLKTDYVDILLAHDIEFATDFEAIFSETADCLHKLKRQGKCRFIGMSCHPLGLLRRAIPGPDGKISENRCNCEPAELPLRRMGGRIAAVGMTYS